ncbi:DUF5412 family protein [Sporolactobacillus sp. STSJ-5]|uniref:DUF5412 family protein n=1 Tax=Sporolactobacillus sp. STSJ-5 TaxID=2965076 RepID=UPI0021020879
MVLIVNLIIFIVRLFAWRNIQKSKHLLISTLIIIGFLSIYGYNWEFNLNMIPHGEFHDHYASPNKQYTAIVYFNSNGLAEDEVLGVIRDNVTNKERAMYYVLRQNPQVKWINNTTVAIGNHEFNVKDESQKYDYRHDK